MLKVGITGLMGSGKSFISSLFGELGVPIYNTDERARWLNNNNPNLIKEITDEFGDVYVDGKLNRDRLRKIVFVTGGEEKLKQLNKIVHPYVFQDFNLFPHLTVLQNCVDPLLVHGSVYDQALKTAKEVLPLASSSPKSRGSTPCPVLNILLKVGGDFLEILRL